MPSPKIGPGDHLTMVDVAKVWDDGRVTFALFRSRDRNTHEMGAPYRQRP